MRLCQLKCIQREPRQGHENSHHWFSPCLCARHCAKFVAQMVKNLPAMQETWGSTTGSGRSSGDGNGSPLQSSCPEKSHGQRSLAGYSPRGCRDLDTTGRLPFHMVRLCQLQCAALRENAERAVKTATMTSSLPLCETLCWVLQMRDPIHPPGEACVATIFLSQVQNPRHRIMWSPRQISNPGVSGSQVWGSNHAVTLSSLQQGFLSLVLRTCWAR